MLDRLFAVVSIFISSTQTIILEQCLHLALQLHKALLGYLEISSRPAINIIKITAKDSNCLFVASLSHVLEVKS